ncbi:MAG: hypothetical protein ACJ8EM_04955 [Sphingomicrobium sp.]
MILHRLSANLRAQNWTAIAIEFLIVVVGVFIGTQVANWNQSRLEKRATERMLEQLHPELRSQLEFFDSVGTYYATTRGYADEAFAGWKGHEKISDERFVIAAYQASQITGIAINPDSWALTFGGSQLRDIDDPRIRRNLELALTADYTPVEFPAVATRYREQVRHVIPIEIQDRIRIECGDRNVPGKEGAILVVLPTSCATKIEPAAAREIASALRARPDLSSELQWHLAAIATFMANVEILEAPLRELDRELSGPSSTPKAK